MVVFLVREVLQLKFLPVSNSSCYQYLGLSVVETCPLCLLTWLVGSCFQIVFFCRFSGNLIASFQRPSLDEGENLTSFRQLNCLWGLMVKLA